MNWENPSEVLKALIALYYCQTQDERISKSTRLLNNEGFNSADASFLTDVADKILNQGRGVTENQFSAVKTALKKYYGQIDRINLEVIELPVTAVIYKKIQKQQSGDGVLRIVADRLEFIPWIYPTSGIKNYGFAWDKIQRSWYAPVNEGNIAVVFRLFTNTLKDITITDWEKKTAEKSNIDDILGENPLFEFQKEATDFLIKHNRSLLALAPGLGKTLSAIMACKILGGRTLIIAPLSLLRNWKNEIRKWTGTDENVTIWYKEVTWMDDWIITNYDTAVRILVRPNENAKRYDTLETAFDLSGFENLIVDESILVKNRKAKRTMAVKAIASGIGRVWLLSGAPTSKFYDDLWAQLHILEPRQFSSYWKFAERYCEIERNVWGTKVANNRENAATNIKNDLKHVYYSKTQDDVIDLPDWIFEDIEISMGTEQYKMYSQMEEVFKADLGDGEELLSPNKLSQMVRLIQLSSNPILVGGKDLGAKWDGLADMLDYVEFPIIIWTNFIKTASMMSTRLENAHKIGTLTGETDQSERQNIVDNFQNGDLDIIIAHPGVGKFGLTLTAARTAIYLERSYNGDDYYQSLHRIRRIGTTKSPHVIHIIAARPNGDSNATIDRVIDRVLKFKRDSSIALTSSLIRRAYDGELEVK